ncbi:hypothetical protein CCAX7_19520 [Capsulimonas corticalis]|uniref:Uncharacterized protein n=1 Tax=Capsulimonas corticalis TaxID=2219043 RepID=A0A9N7QAM3_9BACT|nr:hypothetical protein CCAX7_19520 [Capsulimonas corticalis]
MSRSAGAAISAAPCACLHSIPTLPAAWQNASAPQIAPPALDILAPPSFAHAHANILSETQQRRGPPRAGPFVLSSILSTPSLRAPPIA